MLKAGSPGWQHPKRVLPSRTGPVGVATCDWGCTLTGGVRLIGLSAFWLQLLTGSPYHVAPLHCAALQRGPNQRGCPILNFNFQIHEPK